MKKFIDIVFDMISESAFDKDHPRALSCLDQAFRSSSITEQNAERLRHDIELLIIDALRFGTFEAADFRALSRMKTSLQQAIDYAPKRKAETVENIRTMVQRFI